MILSDIDIKKYIERGEIVIDPLSPENIGSCSVDLTLSDTFLVFEGVDIIDPQKFNDLKRSTKTIKTNGKPFTINPHQFILAMTREKIAISKQLAATLEGRSSIARLGLIVHAAGLVNPGTGILQPKPLVLEVFCENTAPIKLYPGMKIVQIIFHKLTTPASKGYDERKESQFAAQNKWMPEKFENTTTT